MAFYKDPEAMFTAIADRFKRDGDYHWAKAKSGESGAHYGKAKKCYAEAEKNRQKAENARKTNATFRKKSTIK